MCPICVGKLGVGGGTRATATDCEWNGRRIDTVADVNRFSYRYLGEWGNLGTF